MIHILINTEIFIWFYEVDLAGLDLCQHKIAILLGVSLRSNKLIYFYHNIFWSLLPWQFVFWSISFTFQFSTKIPVVITAFDQVGRVLSQPSFARFPFFASEKLQIMNMNFWWCQSKEHVKRDLRTDTLNHPKNYVTCSSLKRISFKASKIL